MNNSTSLYRLLQRLFQRQQQLFPQRPQPRSQKNTLNDHLRRGFEPLEERTLLNATSFFDSSSDLTPILTSEAAIVATTLVPSCSVEGPVALPLNLAAISHESTENEGNDSLNQAENESFNAAATSPVSLIFDAVPSVQISTQTLFDDSSQEAFSQSVSQSDTTQDDFSLTTVAASNQSISFPEEWKGDEYEPLPLEPTGASQAQSLIGHTELLADERFSFATGTNSSIVIIDTGINTDHIDFLDSSGNSRIVYQYDFGDNDASASDTQGHGTAVSSIAAGLSGIAIDANIIALKTSTGDTGSSKGTAIINALHWVAENALTYNITCVNASFGSGNYNELDSSNSYYTAIKAILDLGIVFCAASGNGYYTYESVQGICSPSNSEGAISVGAVYDTSHGKVSYGSGAIDYSSTADQICAFSQRDSELTTIMAPGSIITAAGLSSSTAKTQTAGTSMSTPFVSGSVVVLQQIANHYLGRSLSVSEMTSLLQATGRTIYDGDDENANVQSTNSYYSRLNLYRCATAIYEMSQHNTTFCVVDSLEDTVANDGKTTLREAILEAEDGELIFFDASLSGGTITLSGTELEISKGLTIDAMTFYDSENNLPGLTIDAGQLSRVFNISGATAESAVNLRGLTVIGGNVSGSGAGILSSGVLTISDCLVAQNASTDNNVGGGIYNTGTLTITNTTFSENSANIGGGIYNNDIGTLTVVNSTISENSSSDGGGIYNDGMATVTNTTISGNLVSSSDESDSSEGGGICNDGTLTVTNSMISGNSSDFGGGVYNINGELTVTNSTIAGNTATISGGGVYNFDSTFSVANSIITLNTASSESDINSDSGTITGSATLSSYFGLGYHYDSSKPLFTDAANGDYTLAAGSQALDMGLNQYAYDMGLDAASLDMAGNPRFVGNSIDLGAYEYQGSPQPTTLIPPVITSISSTHDTITFNWSKINNATSYVIEYKMESATDYLQITDIANDNTACTISGLTASTTYTIRMKAIGNGSGYLDSEYSAVKSITTTSNVATNWVVTSNLDDDTSGTLRYAIANAAAGDTITFDSSLKGQKIILSGTELTIDKSLTIDATSLYDTEPPSHGITVDANQQSRVFNISGGSQDTPVKLIGLTITGGKTSSYSDGGGIYNTGTLTVTNSTISGNSASDSFLSEGGGIYSSGTLTVTNSMVSGNTAKQGGGIYSLGATTVTNTTISGNSADSNGGGIYNSDTFTVTNSIIAQNYAGDSCNDIYGTLSETSGRNLIGYNPLFIVAPVFDSNGVLTNTETLDLHLTAGSRAIDAGSSEVTLSEFDLDGNPRIVGNRVDLGAYEFQGTPATEPTVFSTVVDTLNDSFDAEDGQWSLREALYWATDPGTITFDESLAGGTIYLNSRLSVYGMSIDGGSLGITLDAQQNNRVMETSGDVTLNGLTITGGKTSSLGGGVYISFGELTVTNSTISGNTAYYGGGISNFSGTVTVTNSTISGNSGSGIYSSSGELTVANSTISGNSGSGIYNTTGELIVTDTTISKNSANYGGGGIYNNNGELTVTNSPISGNTAKNGGGIYNYNGELTVTNSTIAGNMATISGGGVYNFDSTFTVANSIITLNTASSENDINSDSGTITGSATLSSYFGLGYHYDSSKPLFTDAANDDYTLAAGSQAFNMGKNAYAVDISGNPIEFDLAGNARIKYDVVDLGAYEYQGPVTLVNTLEDSFDAGDGKWSLREALYWATDPGTITFDETLAGGTIYLTSCLTVHGMSIDGGSLGITLDAQQNNRVMETSGDVTLNGLTITGGKATSDGGGIYNSGTLTVTNSTIAGNSADYCGGIVNYAELTVTNSTITGNSANSSGGGIVNTGMLTVTNSTITGNSANSSGGGIYNENTTIVTNSAIAGNSAGYRGGGIYNDFSGTLTVENTTIAGNSAGYAGGGIYNSDTFTVTNSIIAQNYAVSLCNDIYGTHSETSGYYFLGYSPLFVVAPIFDANGVLTNAETLDLHLTAGSRAIDAGSSEVTLSEFDLDGNPRIVGNRVDLGAYEFQGTPATEPTVFSTVVDTLNDSFDAEDGQWSLREALYWATGPETMTFDESLAGGTIYLNSRLSVYGMSIDGGSLGITLDVQEKARVMETSGDVTLNGLTITGGKTTSDGGGIYNSGTLTVTNSTISGNSATDSYSDGGGICNTDTLTVINSTISGNSAVYLGGGIYNRGTLTVTNSMLSGNLSDYGGGITNYSGTLIVTNSTITENSANYSGGICNYYSSKSIVTLKNSIVAHNTATSSENDIHQLISGTKMGTIQGYNNLSSFTGWAGESGENYVYDSSKPLFTDAANGDYTLAAGSQAFNKGDNAYAVDASGNPLEFDLAGNARIKFDVVDLGAYEAQVQKLEADFLLGYDESGQKLTVTVPQIEGMGSFTIRYSTDENFASYSTLYKTKGGTYTLSGLDQATTYYFKMIATANNSVDYTTSDWSVTQNITSKTWLNPMQGLLLSSKFNSTTYDSYYAEGGNPRESMNSIDVTYKWGKEYPGATAYLVQYSTSASFTTFTQEEVATPGSYTIPAMKGNTTYYFRTCVKSDPNSAYANSDWFTSQITTKKVVLDAPTLEFSSTGSNIKFIFDEVYGARNYSIRYSTNEDMSGYKEYYCASANRMRTLSGLQENTTYYFQSYSANAVTTSAYTKSGFQDAGSFTTKINLARPTIKASAVDSSTIQVIFPEIANATSYIVKYAKNTAFTDAVDVSFSTAGTHNLTNLDANTKYFVKVTAYGEGVYGQSKDSVYTKATTLAVETTTDSVSALASSESLFDEAFATETDDWTIDLPAEI